MVLPYAVIHTISRILIYMGRERILIYNRICDESFASGLARHRFACTFADRAGTEKTFACCSRSSMFYK